MNYESMSKVALAELARERRLDVRGTGLDGFVLKRDLVEALETATIRFEGSKMRVSLQGESKEPPPGYMYVDLTEAAPDVFSAASARYGPPSFPTGRRVFRRGGGPYLVSTREYREVLNRGGNRHYFTRV